MGALIEKMRDVHVKPPTQLDAIYAKIRELQAQNNKNHLDNLFKKDVINCPPSAADYRASLTVRKARTWSKETHTLWPADVKSHVRELTFIGYQLASTFGGTLPASLSDIWISNIMPITLLDGIGAINPWRAPLEVNEEKRSPRWLLEYLDGDEDIQQLLENLPTQAQELRALVSSANDALFVRKESSGKQHSSIASIWTTMEVLFVSDHDAYSLVLHCTPSPDA